MSKTAQMIIGRLLENNIPTDWRVMAHISKEVLIDAAPEEVWAAVRDWGAIHQRLAPGFVTDTRIDGGDRIVTFFNGAIVRERLVDLSEENRRLCWSIVDGPYEHHNGTAQVFSDGTGTRFVWSTDLLPDGLVGQAEAMMDQGMKAVKQALEIPAIP